MYYPVNNLMIIKKTITFLSSWMYPMQPELPAVRAPAPAGPAPLHARGVPPARPQPRGARHRGHGRLLLRLPRPRLPAVPVPAPRQPRPPPPAVRPRVPRLSAQPAQVSCDWWIVNTRLWLAAACPSSAPARTVCPAAATRPPSTTRAAAPPCTRAASASTSSRSTPGPRRTPPRSPQITIFCWI